MSTPFKMKGMDFGGSPLRQKKEKVITGATEDFLSRSGLTQEEIDALKTKENQNNTKKKETVYRYDGEDYTLAQIKVMKAQKARKAKKTGE